MVTFTRNEANRRLLGLTNQISQLKDVQRQVQPYAREVEALRALGHSDDGRLWCAKDVQQTQNALTNGLKAASVLIGEIQGHGVGLKSTELGVVDVPCASEGGLVLLCRRLGEAEVGLFDSPEKGYAGRQPVSPVMHHGPGSSC